jgi:hypothetical protein
MPEKKTKVTLPDGQVVEGTEVGVKESTERWTDVELDDGTHLRIKLNVLSVTRLDGQYDLEGNPLYAVKSHQLLIANAPQHLRRGAATSKLQH